MSLTIDEITNASLLLSAEDRTVLAHRLWDSCTDFSDTNVEEAWLAEADRRWNQIEKSEVECVRHSEVMQRLRGETELQEIRCHPEAVDELEHTIFFNENRQSGLGARFIETYEKTISQIRTNPTTWKQDESG